MTDLRDIGTVGRVGSPPEIKTIRPVLVWSAVGAACIVTAVYVYTSWIVSGNATPSDPGPDAIPGGTRWAMTAFQIACPILALVAIVYVVRKSLRERRLCVEAAVVIGSTIAWWHDPLINWFQPVLFYNAGLVNFGNWMENVPGSLSPGSRLMAEPVLMIGMIYVWMPLAMGKLAGFAMRRARHRWPLLGPIRTFCAGWLAVYVIEFPLEIFAVHHGLVAYPASVPALTLWAGQTVQIPVYGPILWSLVLSSSGALMFFRNRMGQIRVEAGVETLQWAGTKVRALLRVLAVTGFLHVVAIGMYDLPVNLAGLYAGPTDVYPTYLRTQYCGPDTPRPCPDGTRFEDP
ncbi:spirocyclase AveC family protein [Mycolicibacterium sp.]|uniref:spirocyclase AveC family protein n=1 Tax=Mycolicibacterium sp. TaxID=2320850 RepID=UPI001A31244F|nr:spirocyclase AveC family protein [Mycolicibacterium sp.]MBJ7336541.1 spirocyclase AveC family protein [Mycolicibacterium sp.]